MVDPSSPAPIEALLAEGAWVRRLARSLASDDSSAADLEQETWLAALTRRSGGDVPPRAWLSRVARNFARLSARSRANRDARERANSRPEAEPSASDSAARLEIQRLLVDALGELAEPYRTTVIWRYFDGLTAAEIARRQGVPAGTVRWRLSEGLTRLRATLDRRYRGDRSAWCALFLPLALPRAVELSTKVLVMTTAQRALVAAVAVVVASIAVWTHAVHDVDEITSLATDRSASLAEERAAPPPAARELTATAANGSRAPIADSAVESTPPAPMTTTARIQARFVDARGRPLAGVRVTAPIAADGTAIVSDHSGTVAFEVQAQEAPESVLLSAARDGYATHFARVQVARARTTELGDVVLAFGGSVAGRVVDERGEPIEGARVLVTQPHLISRADWLAREGPTTDPGVPESRSASDGAFRVDGVPAQSVRVWAWVAGMRWAYSEPIDVPVHAATDGVELVVRPFADDECIRGVVLGPDGRPAVGAVIFAYYSTAESSGVRQAVAGVDGSFRVVVQVQGEHTVTAHDEGDRFPPVTQAHVEPGERGLLLRFGARPMLRVRATSESGDALGTFSVILADPKSERSLGFDDMQAHASGESLLMLPDERFLVRVEAPGFAQTELGPFEPASVTEPIVARLTSLPGVRGRVTANGAPVAGAQLTWTRMVHDRERIDCDGFATRVQPFPEESVETDANGEFWITARHEGPHAILCDAGGFAMSEVSPIDVDPSAGVRGVEIALTVGGAIEGRVIVPGGRDPAGTIVAAHRYDGRPRTVRVGRDGVFRFDRLTPGGWCVRRVQHEFDPDAGSTMHVSNGEPARFETDVDVRAGEVTRYDLRVAEPAIVRAELVWNGSPAAGWTAAVWNRGARVLTRDRRPPGGAFDATGIATIEVAEPGEYALTLSSPTDFTVPLTIEAPVALVPGANAWSASIETGVVEGRVAIGPAAPLVEILWRRADGLALRAHVRLDAEGRFRAPEVPVGRVTVRATWPAERASERRVVDGDVDVRRGVTANVEVP